ncbi:MAG: TrmH family RNA methyltransferase [Fibrobacter intestinalis]|uniref:TrmH family RNA methyltransferase n=1 Tax=Fibrobacter intestinalis TaxID=28122 RepID=UPI003F0DEEDF
MYSERKFLNLPPKTRAKRFAELLRILILQLGNDIAQAKKEYDDYAEWAKLPPEKRLDGKNQAELIELYKNFRQECGLGFERDVYLENEPGDRQDSVLPTLPYSVLAHNLRSAFNVGSLFRTTDCLGLEAVHLSGYTPDISHAMLKSAARGTEKWVKSQRWDSPLDCIQNFRQQGYAILALETGEDAIPIQNVVWPKKGLILLGNEELGIAPELLKECSLKIEIPMAGRKASLNVASAFAILAYAIRNAYGF